MKKLLLSAAFSAMTVVSALAQIPEDGLVGRFEMDNNSLEDSSPNGYDMEPFGAGGVLLPVADRFGESTSAISFVNEYVNMPAHPFVFDFDGDSNMSLAIWIKLEATVIDWTAVLNNWAGFGIGGYYLGLTPDQRVRWNVNADPPIDSDPIGVGDWVHIAVTYDGSDAFLYLNGTLFGQESYGTSLQSSPYSFTAGAQADLDTNKFPGAMDEILVYERPLTAQEVLAIYENVPLSISDFNGLSHHVQVAPNPVQAKFSVNADIAVGQLVSYQITDMKGSIVQTASITEMTQDIDVSNLRAGAYLLTFKSEYGLEITKRLLKK